MAFLLQSDEETKSPMSYFSDREYSRLSLRRKLREGLAMSDLIDAEDEDTDSGARDLSLSAIDEDLQCSICHGKFLSP